jgi:competence protein ComEC
VDRKFLGQSGGLALYLEEERFTSVAMSEGQHGWWKPEEPRPYRPRDQQSGEPEKVGERR